MKLVFLFPFLLIANIVKAQSSTHEGNENKIKTDSFDYRIEASALYNDQLKKPDIRSGINQQPLMLNQQDPSQSIGENTRTTGLRYLKLTGLWTTPGSSRLSFTMRPDVLSNHSGQNASTSKEIDTRSGDTYRSSRSLSFIDEYELSIDRSDVYSYSYGVYSELVPVSASFYSPLQFGLTTVLPQSFSALRITSRPATSPNQEPTSNVYDQVNKSFSLWIIQGRDDRSDSFERNDRSFDEGFVAADPYTGAAVQAHVATPAGVAYTLTGGLLGTKLSNGRKNETFAAIGITSPIHVGLLVGLVGFDTRFSREQWSKVDIAHARLEQQSHALTLTHHLSNIQDLALGFQYGISDRHLRDDTSSIEVHTGWQFDLGYLHKITDPMTIGAFISDEWRVKNRDGEKIGAFTRVNGNAHSHLGRMSIEMKYNIEPKN